jgi:kinesin family protein 18/19
MATKAARGGSAAPAGTEDAPTTQQGVSSPAPLGEREQRERDATRMMVGVRVRPLSKSERAKGSHSCLTVAEGTQVFAKDPDDKMGGRDYLRLQHNKDQAYQFDHAFSDESGSAEVYEKLVQRVVRAVMAGYNGACFAYGATGSGKTFTMLGEAGAPGVMPAAVAEVMAAARNDDECEYSFGVTYVEIYNEKVKDLLNPHAAADLEVREDARQGTHIQGAVERKVSSEVEIMEYMQAGSMYRTTEATNCNEVSSRSHAVLQLSVKAIHRFGEGGGKKKRQSKLSLIDLAGASRFVIIRTMPLRRWRRGIPPYFFHARLCLD